MTLLRAIHDDSMSDALDELVAGRSVVGVMGGHALERGTAPYADAAQLGAALAREGLLVATGGGPGAMEAANLGALCPDPSRLEGALRHLAAVPTFAPDVTAWATLALEVRAVDVPTTDAAPSSIGVPTWFYGHEPPNVFVDRAAKFFSNALREDGLLARCNAGVVVLPGAAGTVQEIFQAATRLYYDRGRPAPLVLVGGEHWTRVVPVLGDPGGARRRPRDGRRRAPGGLPRRGARAAEPLTRPRRRCSGDRPAVAPSGANGSGGRGGELAAGAVDLLPRVSRIVVGMPCARSRSTNCCSTPGGRRSTSSRGSG